MPFIPPWQNLLKKVKNNFFPSGDSDPLQNVMDFSLALSTFSTYSKFHENLACNSSQDPTEKETTKILTSFAEV